MVVSAGNTQVLLIATERVSPPADTTLIVTKNNTDEGMTIRIWVKSLERSASADARMEANPSFYYANAVS